MAEFCNFLFRFQVVLGDAGVYDYFESKIRFYFQFLILLNYKLFLSEIIVSFYHKILDISY